MSLEPMENQPEFWVRADDSRARYKVVKIEDQFNTGKGNSWVDIPESEPPHLRARLKSDSTVDEAIVIVSADGALIYDQEIVEVDNNPQP